MGGGCGHDGSDVGFVVVVGVDVVGGVSGGGRGFWEGGSGGGRGGGRHGDIGMIGNAGHHVQDGCGHVGFGRCGRRRAISRHVHATGSVGSSIGSVHVDISNGTADGMNVTSRTWTWTRMRREIHVQMALSDGGHETTRNGRCVPSRRRSRTMGSLSMSLSMASMAMAMIALTPVVVVVGIQFKRRHANNGTSNGIVVVFMEAFHHLGCEGLLCRWQVVR